jgi:hypothetical protein
MSAKSTPVGGWLAPAPVTILLLRLTSRAADAQVIGVTVGSFARSGSRTLGYEVWHARTRMITRPFQRYKENFSCTRNRPG